MPHNAVAENVLGTIGTVFWSLQLVPQIIKSYRAKDTDGLSAWLLLIWVAGSIPQGTYLVVENINIPLIVQPQLFSTFAIIAMAQCWHYSHRLPTRRCIAGALATGVIAAGVEVAFYELCLLGQRRGTDAATKTMGIAGAVLIVLGLVPQYYEIWKYKEVRGISLVFLAIDCTGGVFSLLSLVFKSSFDGIAAANYIGIVVLELGIFGCYLVLNPKAKRRRQQQAEQERPHAISSQTHSGVQCTDVTPPTSATTPDWSTHSTLVEKTPSILPSTSNTQPKEIPSPSSMP